MLTGCASAALTPDAPSPYQQPWVVESPVDEVRDSIVAALSRRLSARRNADGVTREDPEQWTIQRQEPRAVTVVARSGPLRPAHNLFIRLYPLSERRTLVRAWSRSRIGLFDYGRNRRLLAELMARLERHWAHYGLKARPVAPPDRTPTAGD